MKLEEDPFRAGDPRHSEHTTLVPQAAAVVPHDGRRSVRALPLAAVLTLLSACNLIPASEPEAERITIEPVIVDVPPRRMLPVVAPDEELEPPPDDLWERIRRGFAMPYGDHARVESQLALYLSNPAYMRHISARAQPYLYHIVNEVERRKLPLELALLPIVESAFDPYAYSHGRAAGLWQFIPATGRTYGLEQDWWHDQRRDVKESTRAALDFLEDLSRQFDGDWMLALSGYNAGPGNVRRALRRNRESNKPLDFFALPLPAETQAYVPKLLALRKLIEDPEGYGIDLPAVANEPYFSVVSIDGQLDLAQAATLAGIETHELYMLNPSLNRWATHPRGPHRLLVPIASAEALANGISTIDQADRVSWVRHEIRPGESLSTIARAHNTDVQTLRQVNELSGTTIRAGRALLIPQARERSDAYALSESQRGEMRNARNEANDSRQEVRHRVRPGECFWSIARAHGVGMTQVANWNGMATRDPLQVGQELVLWLDNGMNANSGGAPPAGREQVVRRIGYRVRAGDSLARIASRFGISVAEIADWNQLNTARYLQPGQQLTLYVNVAGAR